VEAVPLLLLLFWLVELIELSVALPLSEALPLREPEVLVVLEE
jgi:hypothetical protein